MSRPRSHKGILQAVLSLVMSCVLTFGGVPCEALAEALDDPSGDITTSAEDDTADALDSAGDPAESTEAGIQPGETTPDALEADVYDEQLAGDAGNEAIAPDTSSMEDESESAPQPEQATEEPAPSGVEEAATLDEAPSSPVEEEPSLPLADEEDAPAKAAAAPQLGANALAAMSKYKVSSGCILEAPDASELSVALRRLANDATETTPYIVYATGASYSLGSAISVPPHVILVAESGTTFVFAGSSGANAMVTVGGVVFGGQYDGAKRAKNVLYFAKSVFTGNNGIVERVVVRNASAQGILANEPSCQNAQAIDCTATGCSQNGLCVLKGASFKLVRGCTFSANHDSGINLSHADIQTIDRCTVVNNGDKGISTNSDKAAQYGSAIQAGCTIGTISNCLFSGNEAHGVYIKPKCYVNSFVNNTLANNGDGICACGKTAAGTTGTSYIKNVTGNSFKNNSKSNVASQWVGSTIYLGNGNTMTGGYNSLMAKEGGELIVSGNSNTITGAKSAGISVMGGKSKLLIKGSGTTIKSSKSSGLYIDGKTKNTATISGKSTRITGGKANGIYISGKKARLTISGSGTSILKNRKSGLYVKGGTAKISGNGTKIDKNTQSGICAQSSAKVSVTGKKTSISRNKQFGIYADTKAKVTYKKKRVSMKKNKFKATSAQKGGKIVKK